jgi:hypothetical protein
MCFQFQGTVPSVLLQFRSRFLARNLQHFGETPRTEGPLLPTPQSTQAKESGTQSKTVSDFRQSDGKTVRVFTYKEGVSKHWQNIQNLEQGFATVFVLCLVSPEGRVATRCGNRRDSRSPRRARDRFSCRVCLSLSLWLWWQLVHCNPFSFCRNLEGERTKTPVPPICSLQQMDLPAELHCTASQQIL